MLDTDTLIANYQLTNKKGVAPSASTPGLPFPPGGLSDRLLIFQGI
jgi:hypothetical protein